MTNLIHVKLPDNSSIGLTTHWDVSGPCPVSRVESAWTGAGLPQDWLLSPPTRVQALQRAVAEVRGARRLSRHLGGTRGRWGIVSEECDEATETLTHKQTGVAKLKYSQTGRLELELSSGLDDDTTNKIRSSFAKHCDEFSARDIGAWLSRLANSRNDGISLRARGGIYFIPASKATMWRRIAAAIAGIATVYRIPAMTADEAVSAVTAALQRECDSLCAEVSDKIDTEVGEKALAASSHELISQLSKIERYENLLGASLDAIKHSVEASRVAIANVALGKMAVGASAEDGSETAL